MLWSQTSLNLFWMCILDLCAYHITPPMSLPFSDVQCVLLGDMLVLLQKQDDKMVLKCQSKSSSTQDGKQMLSPIIKLDSAFLRDVATG